MGNPVESEESPKLITAVQLKLPKWMNSLSEES